jgi:hypothetical protein
LTWTVRSRCISITGNSGMDLPQLLVLIPYQDVGLYPRCLYASCRGCCDTNRVQQERSTHEALGRHCGEPLGADWHCSSDQEAQAGFLKATALADIYRQLCQFYHSPVSPGLDGGRVTAGGFSEIDFGSFEAFLLLVHGCTMLISGSSISSQHCGRSVRSLSFGIASTWSSVAVMKHRAREEAIHT